MSNTRFWSFDVVIVGAGITGLSTALKLQQEGKKCLVAEAATIGFGTSGGTTAHLNTFMDSSYADIEKNFSERDALLVCQAAKDAITLVEKNISTFNISCDFERKDGYLYSQDDKQTKELDEILEASRRAGCDVDYVDSIPLDIPFQKAISFKGQAQFHPTKYLNGLAQAFEEAGGVILENCRVAGVKELEGSLEVQTPAATVTAGHLVYATHVPPGVNLLHFRNAAYRSYVLAILLDNNAYPEGLAYDMEDPYHYYRTQVINGQNYLIAGGEDHKTGDEENTEFCFHKLESYLRQYFTFSEVAFKWSSQYYEPADGLPYIGHLPGNPSTVFTATGYSGNGMIYSHVAAMLLTDIIQQRENNLQALFDPERVKLLAGFSSVVKESADVVAKFVSKFYDHTKIKELDEIVNDDGKIIKFGDDVMAVYRDTSGILHAVHPACTHINCHVTWNNTEKSWDCPCHGSRFDMDGKVLTAPARKNLQPIALGAQDKGE